MGFIRQEKAMAFWLHFISVSQKKQNCAITRFRGENGPFGGHFGLFSRWKASFFRGAMRFFDYSDKGRVLGDFLEVGKKFFPGDGAAP